MQNAHNIDRVPAFFISPDQGELHKALTFPISINIPAGGIAFPQETPNIS